MISNTSGTYPVLTSLNFFVYFPHLLRYFYRLLSETFVDRKEVVKKKIISLIVCSIFHICYNYCIDQGNGIKNNW